MNEYLLILRDNPADFDFSKVSPAEMQAIIQRYVDWRHSLGDKIVNGQKLRDGEGRTLVRRDGGVSVTDGPYAESKEVIGGYFVVEAADYDAAARLVEDCPHLDFGSVEIRQIEF